MLTPHSQKGLLSESRAASARPAQQDGERVRQTIDDIYRGILDATYRKLTKEKPKGNEVEEALDELFIALQERKLNSVNGDWEEFIQLCRRHPVKDLLHQDPFTSRAYSKPRGYAGDAVMLDYIYGREERWPPPQATAVGRRVFEFTTLAPASAGVRARRGFIANLVDNLCDKVNKPEILSLAAGHLREAEITAAVRRSKVGRYVALDSDPRSLREVRRSYGYYGVEAVKARFSELVKDRLHLGTFDLIYSMGLLDYLAESAGRRLVQKAFQLLKPRGRLLVANFLPGIRDVGYMEVFMDWQLTYRTRREMIDLTIDVPDSEIQDIKLFAEENQNILFLQLTKK